MLTVTAICAGIFAILYAIEGNFKWAVIMVFIAAILDGLDGRVARLFKSSTAVGAGAGFTSGLPELRCCAEPCALSLVSERIESTGDGSSCCSMW